MSASDTKKTNPRENFLRVGKNYVLIAIGLAAFGAVYEHFSFGVYSNYMVYGFAVPLLLGALPALLFACSKRPPMISNLAKKLWRDGIAVLTVGSLFTGVIKIYGTDSNLCYVYAGAGVALLLAAACVALFARQLRTRPTALQ